MDDQQINVYFNELKRMSLHELLIARAGWKQDTAQWHAVDREILRRDSRGTNARAWIAIVVSLFSLIVSIVVAFR